MSVDLVGTVQLLHKVFGFLASRSAEQLADLAAGRATLASVSAAGDQRGQRAGGQPAQRAGGQPAQRGGGERGQRGGGERGQRGGDERGQRGGGEDQGVAPPVTRPDPPARPATDGFAEIIAKLRGQPTEADGTAYLNVLLIRGKKATKADLIAIAASDGLTLPASTTKPAAIQKLVDHTIGARQRYAGLKTW